MEILPGWSWDLFSDKREEGFRHLMEFADREGHANVPKDYNTEDGYRLGRWVSTQRNTKDSMLPDRKARLEEIHGWSWDIVSDKQEEEYSHRDDNKISALVPVFLKMRKKLADREGHTNVPKDYKTAPDRNVRLEAILGLSRDLDPAKWEEGFRHLMEFADREGHANVPQDYKSADGFRIGQWVGVQRMTISKISPGRKAQLEALPGWIWRVK